MLSVMGTSMANPSAAPRQATIAIAVNIAAGLWLIFAPGLLNHPSQAGRWNDVTVGTLVLTVACVQLSLKATTRVFSGLNLLFGIWLLLAPFVLAYAGAGERWNDLVTGVVVVVCAVLSLRAPLRVRSGRGT